MKTLSVHIQESFNPTKENQQIVVENQIDNQEDLANENESIEKENLNS